MMSNNFRQVSRVHVTNLPVVLFKDYETMRLYSEGHSKPFYGIFQELRVTNNSAVRLHGTLVNGIIKSTDMNKLFVRVIKIFNNNKVHINETLGNIFNFEIILDYASYAPLLTLLCLSNVYYLG